LSTYDKNNRIDLKWQAMDGVIIKAPLGGKMHRTEFRSKSSTKGSTLVDCKGVPIWVSVDGANRHYMKMSKATLQSIVIDRHEPTIRSKQQMCLDLTKFGLDFPEVYELLEEYDYTIHIRLRGEEATAWMNRFRQLLIGCHF
jgi:putative transposase